MKFLAHVSAVAIALTALPALATEETDTDVLPSASDVFEVYRKAGAWTVYEDLTRGSCLMTLAGENDTVVQIGLTKDLEYGYLGVFSKTFEVEEGTNEIAILVNENVYVGEARSMGGNLRDGYKGGYILSDNTDLRLDIERSEELVAFPDTGYTIGVGLKGARNAIFEVRKCTEELQAQ